VHEASNNNKNEPRDAFASQLNNKKPRAKKTWPKVLGLLVLVLVVAGGIYFTQTKHGRDAVSVATTAIHQDPNLLFNDVNSNIVNILLIGRDVNYKIIFKNGKPVAHVHDENTPARSDTMILLSLNKTNGTIRMISFPRDALVRMPPNQYHVRIAKLNAAHAYGGPAMLEQALRDDLGITVHRYVEIRFDGFKSLIDKVGGIDVDVIGALHRDGTRGNLNYDDNWANLHIHLKPGMQRLNGTEAHNYVRFRMDLEGDPGRIRRQQQVMRALAKKMTEQPLYKIPGLVEEVRTQFKTDMTDQEIASAAFFSKKSLGAGAQIDPVTLFGVYTTKGAITLNRSKNIKLLSYVLGGTFDPSVFLENSPSTERDELGQENDSSPGAQEVLRAAGLLGPASSTESADTESTEPTSASNRHSEPASRSASTSIDDTPRRVRRRRARVADPEDSRSSAVRTESSHKIHELSVDSSAVSESSPPIRQINPASSDNSESSPVPRPE
jgi:LCP family protein required for cell wall assembly